MKRTFILLLLISGLGYFSHGSAQQSTAPYTFEWEVVAVDSIPGMATVRLYAKLVHPTDYLTSVSGWDEMEGRIETTTSFYQDPNGWATPNNNNPLLFDLLPGLRWDSWVTIGIDAAPNGAAGEIPVGLFPPQTEYWVDEFEAGQDLVMDVDGAWFVTLGSSNGTAGEDLRVLVGQFTTDGVITGYLNLQVFSEGVASNEFMDDVYSITIPEFDATGLSGVDDAESPAVWRSDLTGEGNWRHFVDARASGWRMYGATGRLMASGRVLGQTFSAPRGGFIVLLDSDGAVLQKRFFP